MVSMSPRCSAKKYGRFSHSDWPKPRQSGATIFQSRCSSSTTNWKEAETSIQPCNRNSIGAWGSPQRRICRRTSGRSRVSEREGHIGQLCHVCRRCPKREPGRSMRCLASCKPARTGPPIDLSLFSTLQSAQGKTCHRLICFSQLSAARPTDAMDIAQITQTLRQDAVTVVFFNVLLQQLGLPVPAVPTLLLAGSLAATPGNLGKVLAAAVLASLVGDRVWYLS